MYGKCNDKRNLKYDYHSVSEFYNIFITRRVYVEREIINVYDVFEIYDHTINCYKEPVGLAQLCTIVRMF